MQQKTDLIILGGGCAGLSLAMRLAALGDGCPSTVIIERRAYYQNDRTWCFWGNHSASMLHLVSHQWGCVMLKDNAESIKVNCANTPYQMLESSIFYAEAQKIIAQNSRITLVLNTPIFRAAIKQKNVWLVSTSKQDFVGNTIIDTRPNISPEKGAAIMWQSFIGQEITCEEHVFNTEYATLMDFSEQTISGGNIAENSKNNVAFTYVLPLSSKRALIEATVFSKAPLAQADLVQQLTAAITSVTQGKAIKVERSEQGILPMGNKKLPINRDSTYINAGLFAGAARPSSGYAFQRIQRWAEACAASIAKTSLPISHQVDPVVLKWMDIIFLKVMLRQPQLAPKLFLAMFKKVDISSMVRFLSDEASVKDYFAIILALPPLPFLKQLYSQMLFRR